MWGDGSSVGQQRGGVEPAAAVPPGPPPQTQPACPSPSTFGRISNDSAAGRVVAVMVVVAAVLYLLVFHIPRVCVVRAQRVVVAQREQQAPCRHVAHQQHTAVVHLADDGGGRTADHRAQAACARARGDVCIQDKGRPLGAAGEGEEVGSASGGKVCGWEGGGQRVGS